LDFDFGCPYDKNREKVILQFCGVNPVKIASIGSVKHSKENKKE